MAAVLRFFFNVPQWIQIGGFFLGLAAAAWLAVFLWRRRQIIKAWIVTRRRNVKIALLAGAAVVVLSAAGFGAVSWNYMNHENAFCTGCHIMKGPFQRFSGSKHDSLSCHNCHQQTIFASARQMYLWVADRPEEISMHSKVPTRICAACHLQGDKQKEKWKRVATTAGHRVHLESDSSALKGVECTTCHGLEVHRFVPVDSTCGQSGCHIGTEIKLGKMAGQTGFHCMACHQFTADVPLLATRDSAAGTLRPGSRECFSCHEMRRIIETFDPERDPHRQTCGMCHNPHVQTRPADALKSCVGCHSDWRAEPFHMGVTHRRLAERCTTCHNPHGAKVDASDCTGCHAAVRQRSGGRLHPPQPFDTTRAQRTSFVDSPEPELRGKGDAHPPRAAPTPRSQLPAPPDSFPHDRHKQLTCITCHTTTSRTSRLTFTPPRGCLVCHHQNPKTSKCASCHTTDEIGVEHQTVLAVAVKDQSARARPVNFDHRAHADVACATCHTASVTLEPDSTVIRCTACHDQHHDAARTCANCHTAFDPAKSHGQPVEAHEGCAACHNSATVARLVPHRGLCITCHTQQRSHYADRECTVCHLQATPDAYREHLRKAGT